MKLKKAAMGFVLCIILMTLCIENSYAAGSSPPKSGVELTSMLNQLWQSIQDNSSQSAKALFFPKNSYIEMKTGVIANPAADFDNRLMTFYKLDLDAYHRHVVTGGKSVFVSALVNPAQIMWIPVRACENKTGYWHLGPVRIVYKQAGVLKSFAIASLISWNGEWKIIHLGPNPRPHNVGTVDSPQKGPGSPGPGGGC